MTGPAVAMMIAVCGLVWGGFVALLLFVMRREARKR
ncbi:MAG TPA: MetS family NSS transporter small subunit [Candidatus Krumholzibacterium sp.]|nr:MetS family NSS transporter small subunit [Candidatus Krumholzibacterium sp.]